jgi:hypothetical protein
MYTKGTKVRFTKKPENPTFHSHYKMSLDYLEEGKVYIVEHFFEGDPSQIELSGIDKVLFMTEMFEAI